MRVVEAYRQAEMAGRAASVTERAVGVAKAREAEIQARVDTGGALQADLLRARARRREREAELAERRCDDGAWRRQASRGSSARPPASTTSRRTRRPRSRPSQGDEAAWAERALRPAAGAGGGPPQDRRGVGPSLENEKNGLLPDIGVFGQLWDNRVQVDDGNQSWAVGVGLRWAPFDPSRSKRQAAATAEQRAAELELRAAADQVRLEVALAYRRAVSARERHAAAAGGAEEGREALRVIQERRKAGMATLTDELETETAALGAALQEIGAAAEVAIADAALARAAGEIGR